MNEVVFSLNSSPSMENSTLLKLDLSFGTKFFFEVF